MNRLKKILIWLLGIFFTLVLLVSLGLYFFENDLKKRIVTIANESLSGELVISTIEYTLFSSYPKAIVKIDNLFLLEQKENDTPENVILSINALDITVDISELFSGKYVVDKLNVKGGELHLINYKDSTLNILNAIGSSSSNDETSEKLSLNLNEVSIEKFHLMYDDHLSNQFIASTLNSLNSNFELLGDSLKGELVLDYQLDSIIIEDKKLIKNHTMLLSTYFESDLDKLAFNINDGKLKVDRLETTIQGFYNYADGGFVDILISANHDDLSELAKMEFINADYLPDIRKGEFEIDAKIIGKTKDNLPSIEAIASLRNLQLYNAFGKVIDKVGFNLQLKTGNDVEMRDAVVMVDSISVAFTAGGFIKARVEVSNFETPTFSINWEASEDLEDFYRIIEIPEIKNLTGKLKSNGAISGSFSLKSNKLLHHKGAASIEFNDVNLVLRESDYPINKLNGTLYLINNDVGLDEVTVSANGNTINLNGRINNIVPFILKKPAQLLASISVQSDQLNTVSLLAFDTALSNNTKYKIEELDISIMADLSSSALSSYTLIPTGKVDIQKLTLRVEGAPPIVDFSGKIEVDNKLVSIKNFTGIIGKSKVGFSISVSNYADYLQSKTTEQMIVNVSLNSEKANAKDFFTINHKFVLPKNYEEEVLKNVAINAKIITTNTELQKADLIPEFELQLTGLQFQTLYSPVVFKDIFVFGLVKDNNVYINSMFGKFGRSDVFMNAQFDNVVATKDTISRPLRSRISFNAGVLDLDELVKLDETEVVQDSTTSESEPSNPFAEKFPITEFQVNIGELTYFDAVIRNLKGIIKIGEDNKIQMQQVSLESGEFGSFEFDGTLDASSHKEAILKSTIKISDVDLSNLKVKYVQGDEEVSISDHFQGMINGEIVADVPILPDFSFDLGRLTGKVKVKMKDGALINYAPLEEMGKYFKNKDLNYIEFDELKNIMIFNRGKMLLPFMTINTTLGTINLMGFQSIDGDMSYDIQVPLSFVAGSALNSLFASKKGDDSKKDEMKKGGKGKYVTVHISGNDDEFKFKLGKKHVLTAPPGFEVD